MKAIIKALFIMVILFTNSCISKSQNENQSTQINDSIYNKLFIEHFYANFDDIHDVIMRFHNEDPTINGLIDFVLVWENEKLSDFRITGNSTHNDSLAVEIIKKMQTWKIKGLEESFKLTLPLRTFIVGSDNPNFKNTAIFTGKLTDVKGVAIPNQKFKIVSDNNTYEITTNREGIFVKTLIEAGEYHLEINSDYVVKNIEKLILKSGEHTKETIIIGTK